MIYCVNSFVGWILESDILDGCVGYKYPTYGLLWQAFYRADIERKIRDEYLLDKSGAGWYKIRNALKKAAPQTDFAPFETTYAALAAKLEPLVYEYGFLKE